MQVSGSKIRYAIAILLALSILVIYCSLSVTERVVERVEAKIEPLVPAPPPNQVYIVTKVLGIQDGNADAETMEVNLEQALKKGFATLGERDRVKRSMKKFAETLPCKDKTCDIVTLKEQRAYYEVHVICPNDPPLLKNGQLADVSCPQRLEREKCRALVLGGSWQRIKAHDKKFHPKR